MTKTVASLVLLLTIRPAIAHAQDQFILIANQASPHSALPRDEVSKLFLRKRTRWPNGETAEPVDQTQSSPVRRHFSNAVHRMDVPSVKGYWQELVFSGRGFPPPERVSDADVIAFVKSRENALGYVSIDAPTAGVKVIAVIP